MSEVEFIDIFADNLRDLMRSQGISQRELSRESGVDNAAISRYLKKERMPTVKSLINIGLALDCDLDDLIPFYDFIH
jgi:transcriptional regulator with XRE-family HTH domain